MARHPRLLLARRSTRPHRHTQTQGQRRHLRVLRRAANAQIGISAHFNAKQQVFLEFVLSQYVKVGVEELDQGKLSPLLKLKYNNAIADAFADLGRPEEIGAAFAGFQKYLYELRA